MTLKEESQGLRQIMMSDNQVDVVERFKYHELYLQKSGSYNFRDIMIPIKLKCKF